MESKTKRKLKFLSFILGLFVFQIILLFLLNFPWVSYYDEEEVSDLKEDMMYFSNTHQNPDNGLFIEPNIDSCYRAFDSIRPNDTIGVTPIKLINPLINSHLDKDYSEFFFDYLLEKQNIYGSYSDIGGLGNMIDTYKAIETVDRFNPSYTNSKPYLGGKVIFFISNTIATNGFGFKYNEESPMADIISTYCAIELANRFNAQQLHSNENMSIYLNLNLLGAYPELTYYGVNAYIEKGLIFNAIQINTIRVYFEDRFNPVEGGYSVSPGFISDIQSTYYALACLYALNINPTNETKTFNYVLNCVKSDGGFGLNPYLNSSSEFKSGWAASKSLTLIQKNNSTLNNINTFNSRLNYYNWLYEYQAMNGLIGQSSIQSNYLGTLSNYLVEPDDLSDDIDIDDIWDFVEDCYNDDGGFGYQPDTNSSLFSTYCALKLYEIFYEYEEVELPDKEEIIEYLVDLQTSDGGFSIGIDVEELLSLFGPYGSLYTGIIDTKDPTIESTYWGVSSLEILEALNKIDNKALMHWIYSCQSADGGFSVFLGFHSDTISTYFGLATFKVLNSKPFSVMAAVEFLKKAQNDDGSFVPIPALSQIYDLPTSFLVSYFAAKALYEYGFQPENIEELIDWYEGCFSYNTGGIGDYPDFGGDLRNNPYGIMLIEELQYDQDFNPKPWNDLITTIFILEILILLLLGMMRIISKLNITVSKKVKERFEMGEKLNVSYLQKFQAIDCENVDIFAGRKLIVDSVSMQLAHGRILGVLGESGAGKSTFVKSLLGMRKYTGRIRIYGMNVKRKHKKMRPIYGYVPQDLSKIYQKFTTLQNIMFFGKQYELKEKEILQKAKRILRALEIEDKMHEKVENLSGGQKRRVSIAMALIHDPIIVWMDEPTSGLDPVVRENLWLALTKINEQFNTTLIVITHYPEESRFCHHVAIFGRNRGMIDYGRPKDLLAQLPGKGRTVELNFNDIVDNGVERLESIEGIEKALENKVGTDFALLSNLNLSSLYDRIEIEFGSDAIKSLKQRDSLMEEFFRYKAMEVPVIE